MNSSVHIDNQGKHILIMGQGQTQGIDNTILTAKPIYPISLKQPSKRFVLSQHYNWNNSFS